MYRRPSIKAKAGDETRVANLSASGSLWKDALILRDDVAHSLWSQLEGRAIRGSQRGESLATYPFERTTYRAWKERHPETLVLLKESAARGRTTSVYASYFNDDDRMGIFGSENPDARLEGKALVLGVQGAREKVAIPIQELRRARWISFDFESGQAICVYDQQHDAIRCFRAPQSTPFKLVGPAGMGDPAIGSGEEESRNLITLGDDAWDLQGLPAAAGLQPLPVVDTTPVFWFAWAQAHPSTRVERP